jgi:hypothetical protein
MPDPHTIREHKYLRWMGSRLHATDLWHINRHSTSKAVAVGLFCAWIPVPFQMILAALGALTIRANLPVSVALVWLTNPLTMPPMFYGAYRLGVWILGRPDRPFNFELTWQWLGSELLQIWQPFLLGCGLLAICSSVGGYWLTQGLWRWHVGKAWQLRRRKT